MPAKRQLEFSARALANMEVNARVSQEESLNINNTQLEIGVGVKP